jgi:hypothetical protein
MTFFAVHKQSGLDLLFSTFSDIPWRWYECDENRAHLRQIAA